SINSFVILTTLTFLYSFHIISSFFSDTYSFSSKYLHHSHIYSLIPQASALYSDFKQQKRNPFLRIPLQFKLFTYALLLPLNIPKMNDTTRIKIIAPTSVPIILMPPMVGPISKPSALPIEAPMIPAKILPIIPNGISLLIIAPASQPKIPPTIIVHNQPIFITS